MCWFADNYTHNFAVHKFSFFVCASWHFALNIYICKLKFNKTALEHLWIFSVRCYFCLFFRFTVVYLHLQIKTECIMLKSHEKRPNSSILSNLAVFRTVGNREEN